MTARYDDVLGPLRAAYDARAAWRDGLSKEPWKLAERQAYRERLTPGARLLEIGAGTGQDSAYFQEEDVAVVAADLSAAMVEHCRAKGIEAHVMDFLHLDFPRHRPRLPVPVADAAPSGFGIARRSGVGFRAAHGGHDGRAKAVKRVGSGSGQCHHGREDPADGPAQRGAGGSRLRLLAADRRQQAVDVDRGRARARLRPSSPKTSMRRVARPCGPAVMRWATSPARPPDPRLTSASLTIAQPMPSPR